MFFPWVEFKIFGAPYDVLLKGVSQKRNGGEEGLRWVWWHYGGYRGQLLCLFAYVSKASNPNTCEMSKFLKERGWFQRVN